MTSPVLLINTNTVKPPVSPIGLEYVAEAATNAGVLIRVLDFSFEADWKTALKRELQDYEPLLAGLTVRNTDDCSFASGRSFLPWIREVVSKTRELTEAPIFLGGVGFSVMPETVLRATHADGGIEGDGEEALIALSRALDRGEDFAHLPNIVSVQDGELIHNPRAEVDPKRLPLPRRRSFDNKRYQELGAMVGVETKRGCSHRCIYCADPVAKGKRMRLRPPEIVVRELKDLLGQGVSWFHLCDSEFNLPPGHAREICQAIIEARLGDKIRWYTYCSPVPFDDELGRLMVDAGCAGINFGVDSLCDEQLQRLGRVYSSEDIRQLVAILEKAGINYMFDLLLGGPGETSDTVKTAIVKAKEFNIPLVGIATGVRVYTGTPLAKAIAGGIINEGLWPQNATANEQPVFYLSPSLGDDAQALIRHLVGDDPRYLVLSTPEDERNYNYADDDTLSRLIEQGARGAYWDILRNHRL
jgi:hypothetical protein